MTKDTAQNILSLIDKHYVNLSPSGRAIAHYIQQHPLSVLTQSISLLAENTNTSKATVSRFFRQLGFASHQEARSGLNNLREQGVPLASESVNQGHVESELQNLRLTYDSVPSETLENIAELLATKRNVYVIGFRNGYPLALHLRQQLKQIRKQVHVLPQPGQTLSEDLVDVDENDVIVLFGFRRRTKVFRQLLTSVQQKTVVLLTDPTGQIYREQVEHLIVCHVGSDSPFDSYAAPMSVISTLCNMTYVKQGNQVANRVEEIADYYNELNELDTMRT